MYVYMYRLMYRKRGRRFIDAERTSPKMLCEEHLCDVVPTLFRCTTENEHDETISNDDETARSSFDGVLIAMGRGKVSRYSGTGRRDETQERV